jgi:hypothetical protein
MEEFWIGATESGRQGEQMVAVPMSGRDWPPVAKHIVVSVGLLAFAFLYYWCAVYLSSGMVLSGLDDLVPQVRKEICGKLPAAAEERARTSTSRASSAADAIEIAKPLLPNLAAYPAADAEKQRIAVQALKAQRLECLHMNLFGTYVTHYYASVLTSMVFGGITAIALFLTGPKGWSASSPYLVNVLLTSGVITAFFGAFPGVFKQDALIAAHKEQILRYETLLDGMASHTASPKLVPSACKTQSMSAPGGDTTTAFQPVDFIACTDAALASADIAFGFDPKSQPDYQKALGSAGK